MRPRATSHLLLLAPLAVATACSDDTPELEPLEPAEFDETRAWADLEALVSLGPRRIGSRAADEAREFIRAQIEPYGWVVEEDPFIARPPEGAKRSGEIPGVNLLARRPGTEEGEVWLCSHYDTYDIHGLVGANDGGSSSAVLIEFARQLGERDGSAQRDGMSIVLCWFDGEEPFPPPDWDSETNSTFGSRHLAERLEAEGRIEDIHALVLLDMVGDASLGLNLASRSTIWLKDLMRTISYRIGDKQLITEERRIEDDHLPFLKAGVDSINLIDFAYGGKDQHHRLWHTDADTLDKCSPESLGRAGRLVLSALPFIEDHEDSSAR